MQGINLAEQGHLVNVLPPVDITGGKTGDRFSLGKYGKATIVVQVGVSASAFTKIIVKECDQASGGNANAIAFNVYKEETAAGDTLGGRTSVDTAGLTPSANDNIMYVIDVDARELSDGFPFIEVELTNTSNSVIASVLAILTGARHGSEQSPTVLS